MTGSEQERFAQNKANAAALDARRKHIRELNDRLRKQHRGGFITLTPGINALGPAAVAGILAAVSQFDDFSSSNDPYQEYDMGGLKYENSSIIWKIDYYDNDLEFGSPDAADPSVTTRVLTIMLASEY